MNVNNNTEVLAESGKPIEESTSNIIAFDSIPELETKDTEGNEEKLVAEETTKEAEIKTDNSLSSFFDEKVTDDLKLFKTKSQYEDVKKLVGTLNDKKDALLKNKDDEVIDYLDEVLKEYTKEDLNQMSPEQILEIYKKSEGEDIELIRMYDDEEKDNQFKKEYLVYRKETMDAISDLELTMNKLDDDLASSQAELDELVDQFGTMDKYIISLLDNKIEENKDNPEKLKLYTGIRNSFNDSFTLAPLIEYLKTYKGKNAVFDFHNDKKAFYAYRKYIKVNKALSITTDITSIKNFEQNIYSEDEIKDKQLNLFVFILIHYIASMKDKADSSFGVFVTQVIVNMKDVMYNNFSSEENKTRFIDSVKQVLEIINFSK